jgi:integrase
VQYTDRETRKPIQKSIGRVPDELVPTRLAEFYQGIDPTAVRADGSGVVTVGDLLRVYYSHLENRQDTADALSNRTLLFYLGSSKRLTKVVDLTPVADLSEPWVLAVRGSLLGGYAVRTVKADLKFLRQAVVWARRQGLDVPDMPVTHAMTFKGRKAKERINNHRTPTEEEVQRLYREMRRSGTRLAMYIMWQTGCRCGEATHLRWSDIVQDRDGCWVHFPQGKTGPRSTPITKEAYTEIRTYLPDDVPEDAPLFASPAQRAKNTGAAIAQACTVQGRNIEPFTSHGLRRLFTDRCVRARVDVSTYADIAGHSVEVALKHYRTVTVDDKLAALHRLRSPSKGDLLAWIARHDVSEDEAIRTLTAAFSGS